MEEDAYDMISVLTDSKELMHIKADGKGKDGVRNMCKALQDMQEEAKEYGGIETLILDNLEEGKDRACIVEKLVRRFHLTEEKAAEYFEKFAAK